MRDGRINLHVTKAEEMTVKEQAASAGLSVSEYARRRILGIAVVSKIEQRTYGELKRLGGLLKHTHNETGGRNADKTREALCRGRSSTSSTRARERRTPTRYPCRWSSSTGSRRL